MKLKFSPLGNRLLSALGSRGAGTEQPSDRLRDVVGRDRALAVGARSERRSAAPAPQQAAPPALKAVSSAAQPAAAPAASDLAATAAAEERPQRVQHEPIRTRTMARLLAGQGYRQRALAIYEELLAQPGADDALRAEAEALRTRSG